MVLFERGKTGFGDAHAIAAGGQHGREELSVGAGFHFAREAGFGLLDGDLGVGNECAAGVLDGAGDSSGAELALRIRVAAQSSKLATEISRIFYPPLS